MQVKFLLYFILVTIVACNSASAQSDTTALTNQDAIYNRPFISVAETKTAIGGYLEGNTNYFIEDGVGEGFSMEMRRFNIFLYSQIGTRIRFLSELEFEHGTEEIALETALVDFEFNTALNFRAGIIMPAIGLVNVNHDSPRWEFIERPLSSTEIIPTTLSEIGFGLHGKFFPSEKSTISYDAYIVNGLQQDIILNEEGRTHIPSGKNEEMFGEDNNGLPMFNARIGYTLRNRGELGLAYYGGTYNTFRLEGEQIEEKRNLSLFALDWSANVKKLKLQGEFAYVNIDVADDISEIYGTIQYGGFMEAIYPIANKKILGFERAVINASLRLERVDYNVGKFKTIIDTNIGDENTGIAVGLGFRPKSGHHHQG